LFTDSIIGLSLGFNEVVAIKNLILETLPHSFEMVGMRRGLYKQD